jgi:hypothetical protein
MSHPTTHKCPKNGCDRQVARWLFACRQHWLELPRPVRDAVLCTWQGGLGEPGTETHAAAIAEAIRVMNGDGDE